MEFEKRIAQFLKSHADVLDNPSREVMIAEAVKKREAILSANGALVTWTPCESTGRSPKDTYIVRHKDSEGNIDWDSPNNIPMASDTFDMIMDDALAVLSASNRLYVTDRTLGADLAYALRSGRLHRASGELCYHVLDIMHAVHEASDRGQYIQLESTCRQPAPLPMELLPGRLDG